MCEESLGNGFTRWEWLSDREVEDEGFGVDVADVDTTFMGEQDGVAFTSRCNADIVLSVGRVWQEGLNDEVVQGACDRFNL